QPAISPEYTVQCWCPDIHRPANNAPGFAIYPVLRHFPVADVSASRSGHQNLRHYRHADYVHKADINAQTGHLRQFHKWYAPARVESDHFSSPRSFSWLWHLVLCFLHRINYHDASNPSEYVCSRQHPESKNYFYGGYVSAPDAAYSGQGYGKSKLNRLCFLHGSTIC